MKLSTQKKWGQPLDYNPDFPAITEQEECHIENEFLELWSSMWQVVKVPMMFMFCVGVISMGVWVI